jgi:glycosyltransferase involved in cell wall biosynthesis
MCSFRPLVSVVMPSYNYREFIGDAIRSVVSQTLEDWELVIIDDHSTDESENVIRDLMKMDSRIRLSVHARNEGIPKTVNQGIQMASGKYVALTASDDMLRRDALQRLTDTLENQADYGVVIAEGTVIDERGVLTGKRTSDIWGPPTLNAGNFFAQLIDHSFVTCNLFRKELVEKYGIWFDEDLKLANDWMFWLDLSEISKFIYISQPLYYYRIHSRNISRSSASKDLYAEDFMLIPERVFSRHAKILNYSQRRHLLDVAASYCEISSLETARTRAVFYRSIVADLEERDKLQSELNAVKSENLIFQSELNAVKSENLIFQSELNAVKSENLIFQSELNAIKSGFMYRCVKCLASKIDSLFPDGTRRGRLRRRVTLYLRPDGVSIALDS